MRKIVAEKGWSIKALADRWGVSRQWMSKLIADADRPVVWQDALLGCPNRCDAKDNPLRRWLQRLSKATSAGARPDEWGIEPGAILRVERDMSERVPEGSPATVIGRRGQGRATEYMVLLDGDLCWVGRGDLDGGPRSWLHYAGETDPGLSSYTFRGEDAARADLARGELRQGVQ